MLDSTVRRNMEPHTVSPVFTPTRARRLAEEIVGALSTPNRTAAHDETIEPLLQRLRAPCADPAHDERTLRDDLTRLAASTNPYLRGPRLETMWDNVATIVCDDRLSPRAADWLSLHRAVAARDSATMSDVAGRLLKNPDTQDPREVEYLIAAGMTGSLAVDDRTTARVFAMRAATLYPAGTAPPLYLDVLLRH
jgi:hypothetical protein